MNPDELAKKENEVNEKYQEFLSQVREAFDKHCDEIKAQAEKKLEGIPEDDEPAQEEVRQWEESELDKTLAELQELLNRRENMVRKQLEEIEILREQNSFNFEDELAEVGTTPGEHAA